MSYIVAVAGNTGCPEKLFKIYARHRSVFDVLRDKLTTWSEPKPKTDNWQNYATQHANTSVQENAERLLQHIARQCPRPGQRGRFKSDKDYTVTDCANDEDLMLFVHFSC